MTNNDKLPVVSVIIPVYNGEKYINKCYENLKKQTYPVTKTEILFINNNSTDRTAEIIKEFGLQNINCKIQGPSAARNTGIKIAKGEIIIFIDTDCLASEDFIENHVSAHIKFQKEDPDVKIIGGSIEGVNKNYWATCDDFCSWWSFHPKLSARYIDFHVPTANMSVQRDLFDKIGHFEEDMKFGEDTAFCIKCLRNNYKIYFEPSAKLSHINRTKFIDFMKHSVQWAGGGVHLLKKGYSYQKTFIGYFWHHISLIYLMHAYLIHVSIEIKRFEIILYYFPFIYIHRCILWNILFFGSISFFIKNFFNKKNRVKVFEN